MNKIKIFFICIFSIFFICCTHNTNTNLEPKIDEKTDSINNKYFQLVKKGKQSNVTITKLFGGYELGMTQKECEEVFRSFYKNGDLIKSDEVGKNWGTTMVEWEVNTSNCSYVYHRGDQDLYIKFFSQFLDGKLAELICIVRNKEYTDGDKIYKLLAENFENTERGRQFDKFNFPDDKLIVFIKDNLMISFSPQKDYKEVTICYTNLPQLDAMREEYARNRNSSSNL